jgi:anti-anti-sigma factor
MEEIQIEQKEDVVILHLCGALCSQNANRAEEVWNDQLTRCPTVLAINFKDLDYIDSMGVSHLVKLHRNADSSKVELILYNMNEKVNNFFITADLDKLFNILSLEEFENNYS